MDCPSLRWLRQHNLILVKDDQHLTLIYKSDRGMADLAHGLIVGCINHFAEAITVEPRDLADQPGRHVEFELTRAA